MFIEAGLRRPQAPAGKARKTTPREQRKMNPKTQSVLRTTKERGLGTRQEAGKKKG